MRVRIDGVSCSPLPLRKGRGRFRSLRAGHLGRCGGMFPKPGNSFLRFHFCLKLATDLKGICWRAADGAGWW